MATFYFNNAVDSDWNELGNWWENAGFTVPATSLPTSADDVIVPTWDVGSNTGSPAVCNTALISNSQFAIEITGNSITFDTCIIGHSITGDLTLLGECVVAGTVTVAGNCVFNYTGSSYLLIPATWTITGNCVVNDYIQIEATVTGDCVFNDGSLLTGAVTGDCVFNDYAQNQGQIIGDARFNDNSWMLSTGSTASVSGTAYWSVSSAKEALSYLSDDYYLGTIGTVVLGSGINGSSILGVV